LRTSKILFESFCRISHLTWRFQRLCFCFAEIKHDGNEIIVGRGINFDFNSFVTFPIGCGDISQNSSDSYTKQNVQSLTTPSLLLPNSPHKNSTHHTQSPNNYQSNIFKSFNLYFFPSPSLKTLWKYSRFNQTCRSKSLPRAPVFSSVYKCCINLL